MSTTAEADIKANLVRPLRVLESLIWEHVEAGDRAAEEAAEPHYRKAGPLLAEAKEAHFQGDTARFYGWAQKKFHKSRDTIRTWTEWGSLERPKSFKHITDFVRTPKAEGGLGHKSKAIPIVRREWATPAAEIAERARREAFRLIQEESLSRAQEREAQRKLANRLVDIGYKVLAKELHPDRMHGDKEAMQRLVIVRDKLKHSI
jgi:hypothetical protein